MGITKIAVRSSRTPRKSYRNSRIGYTSVKLQITFKPLYRLSIRHSSADRRFIARHTDATRAPLIPPGPDATRTWVNLDMSSPEPWQLTTDTSRRRPGRAVIDGLMTPSSIVTHVMFFSPVRVPHPHT